MFLKILALLALLPMIASAHLEAGNSTGFLTGINHPIHGTDHILAMVAVGLWAMQMGRRAIWLIPSIFVVVMVLGEILGLSTFHLSGVESGILASVLILGILVAGACKVPLLASGAIVGFFALFHGYAHGTEMPLNSSGLAYSLGFVLSTVLLHATGLSIGWILQKAQIGKFSQLAGGAIALGGLYLVFA